MYLGNYKPIEKQQCKSKIKEEGSAYQHNDKSGILIVLGIDHRLSEFNIFADHVFAAYDDGAAFV